jgi:hypothetical protein
MQKMTVWMSNMPAGSGAILLQPAAVPQITLDLHASRLFIAAAPEFVSARCQLACCQYIVSKPMNNAFGAYPRCLSFGNISGRLARLDKFPPNMLKFKFLQSSVRLAASFVLLFT